MKILQCLGYSDVELKILIGKSFLTISSNNRLWMHNSLQQMAWEIVRQECVKEPGKRSRLWLHEDINDVLTKNTGTEAIQGIVLNLPVKKEAHWNPEAFSKMHNLRLLIIGNVQLPCGLTHFPSALRFVKWSGYPLKSLPSNFQPKELVELNMCNSKIELLWEGVKYLNKLKFITLRHSQNLLRTPDFTEVPNLEIIDLEGCTNLIELHSSIGVLKRLILLNLKDCRCLTSLPCKIGMDSLEILILSGCCRVQNIPEFADNMLELRELFLDGTAIQKLPSSIKNLTGLTLLNLSQCKSLVCLPGAILKLEFLREFTVFGCSKLAKFEDHEIAPTHEPQIEPNECPTSLAVSILGAYKGPVISPISPEKQELLSVHGTEVMEKEGRMPILETEIETVSSQPKLTKHVGEPIQPLTPLAVSTSDTSKQAAVEPVSVTVLPSGKDGSQPIKKEDIEIAHPTDGQQFLEVSTCPKSSIERTLLRILRYINDATAQRIGVHGSGGIGKTSVLKALINHFKTKDLFDVVIWVTVSRYWSTRKIQDEVLRQLPPEDLKTDLEIGENLFKALKSRRFLLLLDDVWEQINLDAVGIPNPTLENGSRIILATRSPDVCHIMLADKEVQVERLLPEEAWELFQELVGSIIDSPNIRPYAQDIVQRCGGLPLLIIVTGRALAKENDALCWMHAAREFSRCSAHRIYGFESIFQQLKFSYDRLEGPDLKSCLLYCALFPEDREVSIFELVEYWIEEGLISGNCTDAYKRGYDIVGILVGASLLQSSECGLSIKMHDLIWDLASVILSLEAEGCQFLLRSCSRMTKQTDMGDSSSYRLLESFQSNKQSILHGHQFLVRAGAGLTEPPLKDEWEEAKMIFLMDNELSNLPERPSCPKLLALFLQRNHQLRVIPSSFFDLMPSLTILNLSKTRIKSLPKSLFKLMSLEALILRNCERLAQLPSEVGSLGRLEVLDLQGTEIEKLPDEISELASLRHLKVSFYGSVNQSECVRLPHELVPHGIISSLSELETLSIDVYPGDKRWEKNVDSILNEMGNLTNLITFCCYFPDVKFLERFLEKSLPWKIQGLTDFKFVVGYDVKRFAYQVGDNLEIEYVQWGQCLRFVNGEEIPDAVLEVLTCSTAFFLDHHIKVCSLSEFRISNLNGLRLCVVRDCPKIESVIAGKELVIFPILEQLSIYYLSNLGRLWEGMIPQGSFDRLRKLTVHTCPKLQFVFASSMLQFFSKLEELRVEHCPGITEIIFQDQVVDSGSGTLPRLKTLKLHYLPELVTIMQGTWPPLENISFYNCPMLKKLVIDSNTSHSIKEIKAENHWWEKLEWQDTSIRSCLHAHFIPISDYNL
ncbi:disease resistance protein At4g27190-like [Quercus lobata]|nr:disease resistance protein At4g27190-like [Quercus lobata]